MNSRMRSPGLIPVLAVFASVAFGSEEAGRDVISNWAAPLLWRPATAPQGKPSLQPEQEALISAPLPFVAITPCRVVDTRPESGFPAPYGAPALVADATRDFDLNAASHCSAVPPNAAAYSLNVTVTQTQGPGDLRIWPTGDFALVSTQNWPAAGVTLANAAVIAAGAGGAVTVNAAGSGTHLIIDFNGYYDGNGVITGVTAGTGLSGGGTFGNVTLGVNFFGSGSAATAARSDHAHDTSAIASGLLADARLGGTYSNALTFPNLSNAFSGDGAGLTNLNASNLATGTVPDGRLAGTYSGALSFSNPENTFGGDGSALTNVNGAQRPAFGIFTLDGVGDVNIGTSMTIGSDGLGLIAYYHGVDTSLRVAHCSNAACSAATITTLDNSGFVGQSPSIAIGTDGLALISYRDADNHRVKVAHCSDPACSNATISTLTNTSDHYYSSLAIGTDGLGLIAFYSFVGLPPGVLKVAHCSNIVCSSATVSTLDSSGNTGLYASLVIGTDGLGLISYVNNDNGNLKVAHCSNITCTSATIATLENGTPTGEPSLTIGADGLGLISYHEVFAEELKVAHCSNVACSSATKSTVDTNGNVGQQSSITIGSDGLGLISYYDYTSNFDLKVAHCSNVTCTSATTAVFDSPGDVGLFSSITIGSDGLGILSYMDNTNDTLKVGHCSNAFCTPYVRRR